MIQEFTNVQSFINRNNLNRDIYHDMTPFKVNEILLVSHLYDAYMVEDEGKFSDIMLYDYVNLNLTSLPRINAVSFDEDVFYYLENKKLDLIVLMVGLDKDTPLKLAAEIKLKYPDKPLFILLNDRTYKKIFIEEQKKGNSDVVFIWNGDTKIFFAMIKFLEDKMNADIDTKLASVRLILIVEDSPNYYSTYLTMLYQIIFNQTNKIISEIWTDYIYKALKLRTRPKVLLARSYEEAMELFNKYKDYLYCLLTDIRFDKNGSLNENAGFELVKEIKAEKAELPIIVMSSEPDAREKVEQNDAVFIDKNSESLMKSLNSLVIQNLNFGDFIFKNSKSKEIARASTIKEFEGLIRKVDDETIMYHAIKDDFSHWLMARSEIQLAKILLPKKSDEFSTPDEIRNFLLDTIKQYRDEKSSGNIISIDKIHWDIEGNIISLSNGSFGGKGRGLSFANTMMFQYNIENKFEDLKIKIPKTAVIGIAEFEDFISKLDIDLNNVPSYHTVKEVFQKTDLNLSLEVKLIKLLSYFDRPLAVRSSGSFEDSISQPFSGIFETFLIPNNHPDKGVRLKQLITAIKLVYASVFSQKSKNYAKALNLKLGDEKMAVVIQELVGFENKGLFLPHISGVAQSYNFYSFANLKAEEGFAVTAFGLGMYVVNGENAFRFSPSNPNVLALSLEDQVKYTQRYFYALDLTNNDFDLTNGSMSNIKKVHFSEVAEDKMLTHCVSVYDINDMRMNIGNSRYGQIVVNFASILKNEYIPLAKALKFLLSIFEKSFGSPVEIEFAVDLSEPASFYLLQVKPLFKAINDYSIDVAGIKKENTILYSEKIMGNGIIDYLQYIVKIKENQFDKTKTEKMASEITALNDYFSEIKQQYVLVGPGRWGTRDRFLGVPINWPQISNAKVIVETDLEGFPLDASYGSHFFHNLTTLNVAYFSVVREDDSYINLEKFIEAEVVKETTYFEVFKFKKSLIVKMDGKKGIAIIETT